MKEVLNISNLNTNEDVLAVKESISNNEGVIACEVNLSKKEVNIVFDDQVIEIDKIVLSLEKLGYINN